MTTTFNLLTQEKRQYTCTPKEAVIASFAQSKNDWNTWEYANRYENLLIEGRFTLSIGDWCAFKDGRDF